MQISVIIPTHNCAKYIGRALRSALDQTFPKEQYEVIVVDDGSTDDTKNLLKPFRKLAKIMTLKKNRGLAYARNYAIRNALGKFIVCLDADDYISNNLLLVEHLFLRHNSYIDAVSCDYFIVDKDEEIVKRHDAAEHPIACGIMFYKDKLKEIGLYDESFLMHEDIDLRKRYLTKFNIYNIGLPLYRYRDHDNNLTKKKKHSKLYSKKLHKKHDIKDLHSHLRNHDNLKKGLIKCS